MRVAGLVDDITTGALRVVNSVIRNCGHTIKIPKKNLKFIDQPRSLYRALAMSYVKYDFTSTYGCGKLGSCARLHRAFNDRTCLPRSCPKVDSRNLVSYCSVTVAKRKVSLALSTLNYLEQSHGRRTTWTHKPTSHITTWRLSMRTEEYHDAIDNRGN